ncbi:uncharacterized protein LOC111403649 [Olea europaea var. sylvestris]|uniref:uncharacterized protein LOC111403649 n=1 Tax=Olea europaea var. sylvestris TaxID=158386 RepID=UPI000C1D8CC8|nr:uncharacterized protein LOC111403649 [Olea europaea var. sylvestris]
MNSGVSILGSSHNDYERDYYGMLTKILELEYLGDVGNKVTLFKYDWYDINGGVRVHRRFGLIELNHRKKLQRNDVFILSQQAQQVYYTCFPTKARDRLDWWTVVKTKARNVPNIQGIILENEECNVWVELAFQEEQQQSTQKPVRINSEFESQNLVRTDIRAEEVNVAESRIFDVDSERYTVGENTQLQDTDSNDGFTSTSEG